MPYTPEERKRYRALRKRLGRPLKSGPSGHGPSARPIIAFDGEGVSDPDGAHRYVMLSYSDSLGKRAGSIEAPLGGRLSTQDCFQFLWSAFLEYPHAIFVGFSLGYDWTKILEDLDNAAIYKLYRPELRQFRKNGRSRWGVRYQRVWSRAAPTPYDDDWIVNLDGPQCISLTKPGYKAPSKQKRKNMLVWDVFRFCAQSFVKAVGLKGWNVATSAELEFVDRMKKRRGLFRDDEREAMRRYNLLECRLLSSMVEKIISAHEEIRTPSLPKGLKLTRYDGPGSTVTALFKAWGLSEMFKALKKKGERYSKELSSAIASAFFGGRFEHAMIGRILRGYQYDLHSAYPAEITLLPCMLHGKWTRVLREQSIRGRTALVSYRLNADHRVHKWGPFPFREKDGSICFPVVSGGGYVWGPEYFAAKATGFWPGIEFREAFVFSRTCDCPPPFRRIAELYLRRDEVGKESGEGQALKLGMNSSYGKMAQSVGAAPFQSWIYAGLITAGTRGRILEILGLSGEENLLGVATDGVLLRAPVTPPTAPVTGAEHAKKPLGGWGEEEVANVFLVRPGIVIEAGTLARRAEGEGEEKKSMRARGIGRDVLEKHGGTVTELWEETRDSSRCVTLPSLSRFIGCRQGIYFVESEGKYVRKETFGRWIVRPQVIAFTPLPKRGSSLPDGTLLVRQIFGAESAPYEKSAMSADRVLMREHEAEELDQADVSEEDDLTASEARAVGR
jgi:hypothetical protein